MLVRSYSFRVKPTKKQEVMLLQWLEVTRELYNAALEERREAWARRRKSTHVLDQIRQLPDVRRAREDVGAVPNVVLRGALDRIDHAFKDFYGRCRRGETPGYPRFKSAPRWNTISIDDLERARVGKLIVCGGKRVWVPVLGKLKIKMHRQIEGAPKTMRIMKRGDRWFVRFACTDISPRPLPKLGREVGIDPGLLVFIATSDGKTYANPRPGQRAERSIARAMRRVHRRKLGGVRRREAVRILARKSAHVANIRRQNCIDVANDLVRNYDTIYTEATTVKKFSEGMHAKSWRDVALGSFFRWLREKAENAGRVVVEVPPAFTSQLCPKCEQLVPKEMSVRVHKCSCGLEVDRDIAAAMNILKFGRSSQGAAVLVNTQRRSAKVKSVNKTGV